MSAAGLLDDDATVSCPTCSAPDMAHDDLCHHRNPLCLKCCFGGEHGWDPMPWEDLDHGDAA